MQVAIVKESFPGERRVAMVPGAVGQLIKSGTQVIVESGAGESAGFPDDLYRQKEVEIVGSRDELFQRADVLLMVRALGANPEAGRDDLGRLREGQTVIGMCDPLGNAQAAADLAQCGVTLFALELMPRITRAQSMDVLSSMATVAGYKAVLLAANHLPKMFPMMMTAAGTITAAKVFVIGAGVAGLQAIASARKLGAVVQAYDVRPAAMEQIESLGGKAVQLDLQTEDSEDAGGYAKELTEAQQQRQRELLAEVVGENHVCISTAAIPGRPSPLLITADAVRKMAPGSVIVDLAAERGGNCELSEPDQQITSEGVTILGPTNLPAEVPADASQMFSKNVATFFAHLCKEGELKFDMEDEITAGTLVTRGGQVIHPRLRAALNLPKELPSSSEESDSEPEASDEYQLEEPSP